MPQSPFNRDQMTPMPFYGPVPSLRESMQPIPDVPIGYNPLAPENLTPMATAAPSAPSFGQPVATPPFVPPPPPMPTFGRPPMNAQAHHGAPNFLSAALPILAAALAGGRDPRAVGEGLAAFQRGRQLKMAEQEHQHDRQRREHTEAAEFYSRAIEQSQQIDDPVAFEQWRAAIAPIAELHGVNPAVFTFSDQKRQGKAKKDAQAMMDTLRKVHGADADDPAWQAAHTTTFGGQQVKVSDVAKLADVPLVKDLQGGLVGPARNQDSAQRVEVVVNGKRMFGFFDPKTRKITDAAGADITAIAQPPSPNAGGVNVGSFEDYVSRTYGTNPTPAQILAARKAYNQSDDKAGQETLVRVEEEDADGNIVVSYRPRSEVVGKSFIKPKVDKEPSQAAYQSGTYAGRMEQANGVIVNLEKSIAGMNLLSYGAQKRLPAAGQSSEFQSYDQAARNFINAVLRRESGAAIAPSEFTSAELQYLPQPGDTETTLVQKRANREYVFEQMKRSAGKGYEAPVAPPLDGGDATSALAELERRRKAARK